MRVCLADDSSGVCGLGEEYAWVWVSGGGVWVSGVRWVWVSGGAVCRCLGEVCVGVWGRWVWVSGGGPLQGYIFFCDNLHMDFFNPVCLFIIIGLNAFDIAQILCLFVNI